MTTKKCLKLPFVPVASPMRSASSVTKNKVSSEPEAQSVVTVNERVIKNSSITYLLPDAGRSPTPVDMDYPGNRIKIFTSTPNNLQSKGSVSVSPIGQVSPVNQSPLF